MHLHAKTCKIICSLLFATVLLTACGKNQIPATPTVATAPTVQADLPKVTSVELDRNEVPRYESLELTLKVEAKYSNPYDAREVALEGVFTSPDGSEMKVPGFWDGVGAWKIRFTPSQEGVWSYSISITDKRGPSLSKKGEFTVTPSDLHGWIVPGNSFNSDYSGHYLVYQDGTPFYGVGHGDALNILVDGFDAENGVHLFDNMKAANENYVVWWPMYSNSLVHGSYNNYSSAIGSMSVIDAVVRDAQKKGIYLIFTIWDHPELRDNTHAWGPGNWPANGFSKLGDIKSFFVSDEAWAWQENLYRYIIARWGYSPAIGMWQTVSEIDGTNAYDQTDPWHAKVNQYFVENDPYRHLTTASGSGEADWPTGHLVMDVPQVHLYQWNNDAVGAAQHASEWTSKMWDRTARPNWIGEFGVPGNVYYPELFHHALWAALASGASMTPAEWNGGGAWGEMTPEMSADISRLAQFVQDLPLAKWNPSKLEITSSDKQVRAWGLAGKDGGLLWVQDFSLQGKPIEEVRSGMHVRKGVKLEIQNMTPGSYAIQPYDTWKGVSLEASDVECKESQPCVIALPNFTSDIAFKITRK